PASVRLLHQTCTQHLLSTLKMVMLRVSLTVLAVVLIVGVDANPLIRVSPFSGPPIPRVDRCLLACDVCYKEESLLQCANECIKDRGRMNLEWSVTCPFFDTSRN
ncbi:hypothetical protein OTU49_003680, partial [Cherax quadricarinatus]